MSWFVWQNKCQLVAGYMCPAAYADFDDRQGLL